MCFPSVARLAEWSGLPRGRVSWATNRLELRGLIRKEWVTIGGKPRRRYTIVIPDDPTFPDYRKSCYLRDPKTGRLQGRRKTHRPDDRERHPIRHRDSSMIPDSRASKHFEADEKGKQTKRDRESLRGEGGNAFPPNPLSASKGMENERPPVDRDHEALRRALECLSDGMLRDENWLTRLCHSWPLDHVVAVAQEVLEARRGEVV